VAVDGAVTEWASGDLTDPDLEIRLPFETARRHFRGEAEGTETLAACIVVSPDGEETLPTPLDLGERPELDAMPYQPDATLLTQYHHRGGPFGTVDWWWQHVDGRSDSMGFGVAEEPDVTVKVRFQRLIEVRTGEISIYEAIEGGRVDGDVGPLMLLAGLYESPEQHEAELACGPAGPVLAKLGLVMDQEPVREGLAALAAETS
jgi:hypothetical protein